MGDGIKIHYRELSIFVLILILIPFSQASCQEQWVCFDWNQCFNNLTERQCFDVNSCGTVSEMPSIKEQCSKIFPYCYDGLANNDETDIDCGGSSCGPCSENRYCLKNNDCSSFFCENAKCSIRAAEKPAMTIITLDYAYFLIGTIILVAIMLLLILYLAYRFLPIDKEFESDMDYYLSKTKKKEVQIIPRKEWIDLTVQKPSRKIEIIAKKTADSAVKINILNQMKGVYNL